MARSLARFLYCCLLRLHPPSFKTEFANEMLWIFDEVAEQQGVFKLFADGLLSLVRQWIVRYALQKLLIGDAALSSWPSSTHELFAWERIAFPATSLSIPRMLQGSMVSFAFMASLSFLAIDVGKAGTVRGLYGCSRDPVSAPRPVREGFQTMFQTWPLAKEIRRRDRELQERHPEQQMTRNRISAVRFSAPISRQ